MNLVQHRAKKLESAISFCLLAVLLIIGLGVFFRQFDVDMSRFGTPALPETSQPESQETKINTETSLIITSAAPAGYETSSKIELYNADNLYEKIDLMVTR